MPSNLRRPGLHSAQRRAPRWRTPTWPRSPWRHSRSYAAWMLRFSPTRRSCAEATIQSLDSLFQRALLDNAAALTPRTNADESEEHHDYQRNNQSARLRRNRRLDPIDHRCAIRKSNRRQRGKRRAPGVRHRARHETLYSGAPREFEPRAGLAVVCRKHDWRCRAALLPQSRARDQPPKQPGPQRAGEAAKAGPGSRRSRGAISRGQLQRAGVGDQKNLIFRRLWDGTNNRRKLTESWRCPPAATE